MGEYREEEMTHGSDQTDRHMRVSDQVCLKDIKRAIEECMGTLSMTKSWVALITRAYDEGVEVGYEFGFEDGQEAAR